MENKQNSSFSVGSFLGLIICLLASVIVVFMLVVLMDISKYDAYVPALIFAVINMLIITAVIAAGNAIIRSVSLPFYIQIAFITFVYTLFQFVHLFLTVSSASAEGYTFYHLCVLLGYLIVETPVILMGIHNKKDLRR